MQRTDVVVIGAGQAGLAMSRCLAERGIDHRVLERGRIAERWRSERWDSFRLLSPNWQTRLPGRRYEGPDPDGFMTAPELVDGLEAYARAFGAPVQHETTVRAVRSACVGYHVSTDQGELRAHAVVIATGYCDQPFVPSLARGLDREIVQLTPSLYRNPGDLPPGGVLVVGASATGAQLADELRRAGRRVTLAVGRHVRMPRSYRGRDIMWWLDRVGVLAERADEVPDLEAARSVPSMQLTGRPGAIDLPALRSRGIQLCGRLVGIDGRRVELADDLGETSAHADRKLSRVLSRIDAYATVTGLSAQLDDADRPAGFVPSGTPTRLNLRREGIRSVLWATGFQRSYPWLQVPHALDARGELRHAGGVMTPKGLYALGLRFMRRRDSSFIEGAGHDALALSDHLARWLSDRRSLAA